VILECAVATCHTYTRHAKRIDLSGEGNCDEIALHLNGLFKRMVSVKTSVVKTKFLLSYVLSKVNLYVRVTTGQE
jgi:hypothetical protein